MEHRAPGAAHQAVAPAGRGWAIVTGASRGIGASVAQRLGTDGYGVILVASSEAGLQDVAARLRADGVPVEIRACDLADRDAVDRLTTALRADHPEISALVHCAGLNRVGPLASFRGPSWDDVLEVNLRVAFELVRALEEPLAAAADRRPDGASVVNISSVMGLLATPGMISYVASKGGLDHMTRGLAVELGHRRIRVNAVCPGFIRTDMFETSHPPERKDALARAHPMGRVGRPHEVAAAVSFLCSEDASFITGAVIPVDGGLSSNLAVPRLDVP